MALETGQGGVAELAEPAGGETAVGAARGVVPFGYAKSKGVLLESDGTDFRLLYCEPLDIDVLLEVRRHLGQGFTPIAIEPEAFQRQLTGAYQRTQNEAAQMAEDISADVDLSRLVDEIPDLGDLMDAEDLSLIHI